MMILILASGIHELYHMKSPSLNGFLLHTSLRSLRHPAAPRLSTNSDSSMRNSSVIINSGVLHVDHRPVIPPPAPRSAASRPIPPALLLLLALSLLLLRLRKGAEEGVLPRLPLLLLLLLGSGSGLHV